MLRQFTPRRAMLAAALALMGCVDPWYYGPMPGGPVPQAQPPQPIVLHANPATVPPIDREYSWNQLVDVVDTYFDVAREQRVRQEGDVLIEGRIDTLPQGGATLLEPWRPDSVGFENRLESTLQTIRRRAVIRVIPAADSYQVEVAVFKELADIAKPALAPASAAAFRDGFTLPEDERRDEERVDEIIAPGAPLQWIPQGRDIALEQQIISDLYSRFGIR